MGEIKFAEKQKRIATAERLQKLSKHKTSDALARLKAFGAYVHVDSQCANLSIKGKGQQQQALLTSAIQKKRAFCSEYSLHEPTLTRMHQIEKQLKRVLKMRFPTDILNTEESLAPPSESEEIKLRQILLVRVTCIFFVIII